MDGVLSAPDATGMSGAVRMHAVEGKYRFPELRYHPSWESVYSHPSVPGRI